jgi:hypothetical protein
MPGLLDPADQLAARLARDGDPEPIHIEENDTTFAIGWKGRYRASKAPPSSTGITIPVSSQPSLVIRRNSSNRSILKFQICLARPLQAAQGVMWIVLMHTSASAR